MHSSYSMPDCQYCTSKTRDCVENVPYNKLLYELYLEYIPINIDHSMYTRTVSRMSQSVTVLIVSMNLGDRCHFCCVKNKSPFSTTKKIVDRVSQSLRLLISQKPGGLRKF